LLCFFEEPPVRGLLVEDDLPFAAALLSLLKVRGYTMDAAHTLADAVDKQRFASWDFVLLDLHLPDGEGLDFLKLLRTKKLSTPVIVLTAKDQISDRIRGLDAGADDYLVKPFDSEELLARLRAVSRRALASEGVAAGGTSAVTLHDLTVDMARGVAVVAGLPIDLTAKEWGLLRFMALKPDRIHSAESLTHALYGFEDEVDSNTLQVFISSLRRKLGAGCIETLRGQGYRLIGKCT
jgi:two-component system, OmpR family, response regulator